VTCSPTFMPARISLHVVLMPSPKSLLMLGWKISIQIEQPLMFCLPPCWGAVLVGAVLAVADLHGCFAVIRGRLAALDHLQRQGVARERIMAGIAIDGWEQIERAGFINDRRIRKPADAYRPLIPDGYPDFPTRGNLSALVPEYIVTADRTFHPGDGTPFPACPYPTWLPPYGCAVSIHHHQPPVGASFQLALRSVRGLHVAIHEYGADPRIDRRASLVPGDHVGGRVCYTKVYDE
jgi:hypothetical protein